MKKSMTSGNPLSLILQFTIPLLLGNLFQQTYNLVDAAIVGQTLGADALAAVGSTSSVQFLVLGLCMGICAGFAIPIAQRFGAEDIPGLKQYEFLGTVLLVILGSIVTIVTVALCSFILMLLQVPQEIFQDAYWYLVVIFMGIPFTLLYNYLSGILRSIGDSKTPFYFLALSATLNIGLDFYCIVNLGWGVAGAAIATVISQAISGILCFLLILKKFEILKFHRQDCHYNGQMVKQLLLMGIPMGLQFSITAIGSMMMQSANNSLGTLYVSAITAGMKIKQLMMCPFDALGTAVSTFVSQNVGARKMDRIYQGIKTGLLVGIIYSVFATSVLWLFGRQLSMLFISASMNDVLDASYLYLSRMGTCWAVLCVLIIARMAEQGIGYATRGLFAGVVEMICRSVVAIVFVPIFAFHAITWCDQVAWIGGAIYIVPMLMITLKHLDAKLKNEKAAMEL